MQREIHSELVAGLQAAAAGAFAPRFYRVRVSPRRVRRYRRPGMASPLTMAEARPLEAFRMLEGCSILELARRFHCTPMTVRKALCDARFCLPAGLQ